MKLNDVATISILYYTITNTYMLNFSVLFKWWNMLKELICLIMLNLSIFIILDSRTTSSNSNEHLINIFFKIQNICIFKIDTLVDRLFEQKWTILIGYEKYRSNFLLKISPNDVSKYQIKFEAWTLIDCFAFSLNSFEQ